MLEFVIGRAGSGKSAYCLDALREQLRQDPEGPALILLLPEHMTFKVERELAGSDGIDGFSRSYVFGFRRLARQILLETGGALYPRITDIGKRLLLSRVLAEQRDQLSVIGRAAHQRNFAESMAGMIEEFKSYGISAAALAGAAKSMSAGTLQGKLEDLAAVYQGFDEKMAGRYNDAEDMLELLAEKIPSAPLLENAEVWIDGFVFFNPQEMKILSALLLRAKAVHITLCLENPADSQCRQETALFYRQWKTYEKVRQLAEKMGIECQLREMPDRGRFLRSALAHVEQYMFAFPAKQGKERDGVAVVEAANRRLEIEAVAADVVRLCREEGCRWRDIGVLIREDAYQNIVETVFSDYEIPFFSDSKRRSVHHPLAELMRSALEAIHGWRYEPLFRCFKTDFFPVTRSQIDLLENYVLAFGIRGQRWTMAEDWTYYKRLSLEEEPVAEEVALQLDQINHIRHLVMAPLLSFADKVSRAQDVLAQTRALYELLIELEVPETLEQWAKEAERVGDLAEAREHGQIWQDVMELQDQLVEICGGEKISLAEYEAVLNDGLDGLQISLIPPGLDCVTIASFDQNSLENLRAIYIVGANESVMPRRAKTEGLLNDADRARLMAAGIELAAGSSGDNFAEKYQLYKAFTLASEYLWLSYPLADAEGSGLNPSSLISRMKGLLPELSLRAVPLVSFGDEEALMVARGRTATAKLAAALRHYREEQQLSPFWQDVYNWALEKEHLQPLVRRITAGLFATAQQDRLPKELARALYTKNKRLRGSVTRFERFCACPFQHFSQYGLRLRQREEFSFAPPDLGMLLHASLKAFGDEMAQQGRIWSSVPAEECQQICQAIVSDLAPKLQNEILLSTAQYQHLLGRIERTVERAVKRLIGFSAGSDFQPVELEKSFGRGVDDLAPLAYKLEDGYKLEIVGQIDRIDADPAGQYFLVIDYKSGNAYLNLIEVYYGLQLQLMTYLLVAKNASAAILGKPSLPAGMLYCFLKNPLLSESHPLSKGEAEEKVSKLMKMPGWVLADPDVIRKIDTAAKFIKVSLKADGTIYQSSRSQVKSGEDFAALMMHIDGILQHTGQQILNGETKARPYRLAAQKEACTYCLYRPVCQFDLLIPGNAYRQLKKIKEEDIMQAISEEVGSCPGLENS